MLLLASVRLLDALARLDSCSVARRRFGSLDTTPLLRRRAFRSLAVLLLLTRKLLLASLRLLDALALLDSCGVARRRFGSLDPAPLLLRRGAFGKLEPRR